ncbi:MAG: DUF1501 domain-containing protein [Planctomycetia bacterium]|nr:DUF1501 domain-containing protein [Planctomycetia bacterium]
MLHIVSGAPARDGSGVSRRDALRIGALGLGGLALPGLLAARSAQAEQRAVKDTSVVFLFLSGGPSHIDTYDMKPQAPAEVRGPFKPIATRLPGLEICELMPRQAEIADKFSLVRTFSHEDGNHGSAVHWVATGVLHPPADLGAAQIAPFPGSVAARVRGERRQTGMPPYVSLHRMPTADGPAYLGVGCAPFEAGGPATEDLVLPSGVDFARLSHRRQLLADFDRLQRLVDTRGMMEGVDDFRRQALSLVLGREARDAFDLDLESPAVVAQYGGGLGRQMLLARRLCEAGAAFVTIEWSGRGDRYGWDNHRGVFEFLRPTLPVLDHAVATFIDDVNQRGLSERILLVVMGEMGRTPKINANAGRDHWPQVMFALFSGGGLKMGQVIGQSSANAESAVTAPHGAQDLLATIYHVLGIDRNLEFLNGSGRPMPILTTGRPIAGLV